MFELINGEFFSITHLFYLSVLSLLVCMFMKDRDNK